MTEEVIDQLSKEVRVALRSRTLMGRHFPAVYVCGDFASVFLKPVIRAQNWFDYDEPGRPHMIRVVTFEAAYNEYLRAGGTPAWVDWRDGIDWNINAEGEGKVYVTKEQNHISIENARKIVKEFIKKQRV